MSEGFRLGGQPGRMCPKEVEDPLVTGHQYLRVKAKCPHVRRRRGHATPHVTSLPTFTGFSGLWSFVLPAVEFHLEICPRGNLERPSLEANGATRPFLAPTSSVVVHGSQLTAGELESRQFAAFAQAQSLRTRRARIRGHRSIIRKRTAAGGSC